VSDQPEKQLKASPSTGLAPLPATAPSFATPATSAPAAPSVDIKSAIAPIAAAIGTLFKQTGSQSASGSSTDPSNGLLGAPGQPTQPVVGSATQPVLQSNFGPAATQIPAPVDAANVAPDSIKKASSDRERSASLLGNWRADTNKPSIRIKPCGPNLCGYASNLSSNQTEEKMLIDLKPISSTEWVGMILNQDTKITYPTIVMLEDDNSLRVRSCGLSAAFCAGQVWSREAPVLAVRWDLWCRDGFKTEVDKNCWRHWTKADGCFLDSRFDERNRLITLLLFCHETDADYFWEESRHHDLDRHSRLYDWYDDLWSLTMLLARPWTVEEDEKLKAFLARGASIIRAAAALKRKKASVRERARKLGCPFPTLAEAKKKWADTPNNEWRDRWGWSDK
jgi:uncharacterized protein (DUF2147 family)